MSLPSFALHISIICFSLAVIVQFIAVLTSCFDGAQAHKYHISAIVSDLLLLPLSVACFQDPIYCPRIDARIKHAMSEIDELSRSPHARRVPSIYPASVQPNFSDYRSSMMSPSSQSYYSSNGSPFGTGLQQNSGLQSPIQPVGASRSPFQPVGAMQSPIQPRDVDALIQDLFSGPDIDPALPLQPMGVPEAVSAAPLEPVGA